jgi:hypothetical protein
MKRSIDHYYYLIQIPKSRSNWMGKYDGMGKRCCPAAVCEQKKGNMGNTLVLLRSFAKDLA